MRSRASSCNHKAPEKMPFGQIQDVGPKLRCLVVAETKLINTNISEPTSNPLESDVRPKV